MASVDRSLVECLPLFAGLAPEQIDQLLQEAQSVRYPKGTNVFQQDEEAHSFFILLHGHLRVFKLTPDGQQVVVRFVAPGEVFGVAMAIGRKTYPATATAVVDSIALVWPSAAWPRLVATHPGLAVNTLQTVGSRLQDAHTRVVEMSTEQVERRIAHALLRLASANNEHVRNLLHLGIANLEVDLFAAIVQRDTNAGGLQLVAHLLCVLELFIRDREDRRLDRREPHREGSRVMFNQDAEETFNGPE